MKDNENGVWRTIGGRRVFIRSGQSLSEAMKTSGKFKTIKKDGTPSYKQNSQINYDIKHLEAQIETTRKENAKLERIMNEERQKNGELSDRYLEAEREYRHNEEYIMRRQNDIAILEKRRGQIATQNEFGITVKQEQLNALRQVGNIEENQRQFENDYIAHKRAREELNRAGGMQNNDTRLINKDFSAEMDYAETKNRYERIYGPEATREMIERSQESLDRESLAKEGYRNKTTQDKELGIARIPGTNKETNLYKYTSSQLRSLAQAYGVSTSGLTQDEIISKLIAKFNK